MAKTLRVGDLEMDLLSHTVKRGGQVIVLNRKEFALLEYLMRNLHKGRLGEEAITFGSLFLSMIKNALFSRQHRTLYALYCDEIQNLVAHDSGLDMIFSEGRKFGISVVSANQFLDQYPAKMRSAVLGVGTQIFFRLTGIDAQHVGNTLGGGRALTDLLINLEQRHMLVKSGPEPWQHVCIPHLDELRNSYASLRDRSSARWARRRDDIERDIADRQKQLIPQNASLKDWD